MIRPKAIVAASIKITVFWSLVIGVLYANLFDPKITLINSTVIALALAVGVALSAYFVWYDRRHKERSLEPQTVRWMQSTFASIPVHAAPLRVASDVPTADFYPREIPNFIETWRHSMAKPMATLLDAVLKTLWQYKETPAAPLMKKEKGVWISNGSHNHGGRSLVTHSLLVANLMCEQAKFYQYEVPKHKGMPLFKQLDPAYRFDPADPLIPIIGLAHDIGKIECMIWEDGRPNKMDSGHDFKGAAIVARMDAFWDKNIDAETRRILQTILAHYHHVQDVPMQKSGEPTSDRLHALMELLVKCDRVASAMENCDNDDKKEIVKRAALEQMEDAGAMYEDNKVDSADLMSIVRRVLLGPGRINNRAKGDPASIGWKYFLPQYKKTVVVLKEDVFIQAIADYMGVEIDPEARTGGTNPVLHLTQDVLKTLNVANLLFNDFDPTDRSAMSQLYRADFYKPTDYFADKALRVPKDDLDGVPKLFSMDSLVCIQIDGYEALQKLVALPDYNCVFHMGKARLGNQGVRASEKKAKEAAEAAIQPASALDRVAAIQQKQLAEKQKQPQSQQQAEPAKVDKVDKVDTATKTSVFVAPLKFKTLMDREFARNADQRRFKTRSDNVQTIIYDCEDWLRAEATCTFEELQQQDVQWQKLAGIVRLHVSQKGTKIIYIEKAASTT